MSDVQHYLDQRDRWAVKTWGDRVAAIHLPVLGARADRFAAHVATMTIHPAIASFAEQMAMRFGAYVRVHAFVADWLTALLIVRYGEEPDAALTVDGIGWPTVFTVDDHARADALLRNDKWPAHVVLLTPPPVIEVPE